MTHKFSRTKVLAIMATGLRGKAKGQIFEARPNRNGEFVLHRSSRISRKPGTNTNLLVNKILVKTKDDARRLLEEGQHEIRLYCAAIGQSNLYGHGSVVYVCE